ncbi:MAG: YqgE/AlgH family protein [Rhodobacter sp.]|uniref:YqgE/AlgH family protein n=1 Tax=Pararhodobacter sp. TaxID=2127056 RepID=UPI002C3532D0|nr:YqgE/AlgH family protein [Pararhodobacter sp.]MCC0073029.1 YqgE/AlgH family protein [Rhodobacter sp.]HPD91964.1 YqgE/AlgH family protein [Pararhodobacter sp.]
MAQTLDLTGTLLISTPAMGDPRFAHSVIYLCAHSDEGAFGLVLNRPLKRVGLADVLDQVGIEGGAALDRRRVLAGGPVETQRGFVLHDGALVEGDASGQTLPDGLVLSASTDVLKSIARGEGPRAWLLALGYAGWGPGQLESEIGQNAWLTCNAQRGLIFDPAPGEHQWNDALRSMGVDPLSLSAVAGRA